jgi:spore coat protein CotF
MKIITKVKNTQNTSIYKKNVFNLQVEKQNLL